MRALGAQGRCAPSRLTCTSFRDAATQAARRWTGSKLSRVEGRRVAGRASVAHPVLSQPGRRPIPVDTFPPPALRTRRADFRHRALQWNHAARTRVPGRDQRTGLASGGTTLAPLRWPAGASSGLLTPWRQRPFGSSPSLVHVMTSGIPAHLRGTRPSATPVSLLPFAVAST